MIDDASKAAAKSATAVTGANAATITAKDNHNHNHDNDNDRDNDRVDWVFHSRFERGGAVSLRVFCQLTNQRSLPANAKFRVMDYFVDLKNNGNHKPGAVTVKSSNPLTSREHTDCSNASTPYRLTPTHSNTISQYNTIQYNTNTKIHSHHTHADIF